MKVILKPAGVAIVLVAFSTLVYLALSKTKGTNEAGAPSAGNTPQTASASTPTGGSGGGELSTRVNGAVDWSKAKRILEPDITGPKWRSLTTAGLATTTVVPCSIKGHPNARRIAIKEIGPNPWDIQIAHPLEVAFKKGSHVRLTYWGRSKDNCTVAAVVEQASEPYTKIATRNATLTPEWKQYSEEWLQTADTESGWAHIDFQVGYKAGEIELTGVVLDAVN